MNIEPIIINSKSKWSQLNLRELFEYRDVFFMLAMRDIKIRYTQTFLGVFWVLLQPLLTAFFFSVIFGRFAKLPSEGVPYLLYAFSGLIPWMFFSQALQRASMSLINDERLITKVYFPRMIIPLSCCAGVLIDLFIGLGFMGVLLFAYKVAFTWKMLILPLFLVLTLIFTSGLSLFFSALNVYYRDFKHLIPFCLQFWMYACPIIYATSLIPAKWQFLYHLNPMTGIIDCYRWSLIGTYDFPFIPLSISLTFGLFILLAGVFVFKKVERYFADVI